MQIADIYNLLKENKCTHQSLSAAELVNISKFAQAKMRLDKNTQDIYYELDIHELSRSSIPQDELLVMKDQGWSIKDDKLILYQ